MIPRLVRRLKAAATGRQNAGAPLARRPAEIATSQQVKVNVKHRLPGGFAVIHDRSIAIGGQVQIASDLREAEQRRADRRHIRLGHVIEAGDVFARNDNDVRRCLRIDVVKGDDVGIFVDFFRRDLAECDAAEEAAFISSHGGIIR